MSESWSAGFAFGIFILFVVTCITFSARSSRRRNEAFAALAQRFGATVDRLGESSTRFVITVAGRELEVRDAHRGGGIGSQTSGSQYFTVSTRLRGRAWDLHSVDITRRRRPSENFEAAFKVHDLGLPMREGWLDPQVRSAIAAAFSPDHRLGKISIDAGELVYLLRESPGDLSPPQLEAIMVSNADLATLIEAAR